MTVRLSVLSAVFAFLLLFMAATHLSHAGGAGLLPDASWAVFFLGGFYLAREWRWALAVLLLEAVLIDGLAIRYYGISNYCATLAYWFIVPGYSVLWLGGGWLRKHYRQVPLDLARLLASLVLSVTICFLITHSAFYWIGGRVEHPTIAEWWSVFTRWYGLFLGVTCAYVGLATLAHFALTRRSRSSAALATH
jgi:ribose/xylose/arabinose/galactoside ABC-type transport system permease subunit